MIYNRPHCSWWELKRSLTPFTLELFERWYNLRYKEVVPISLSHFYDLAHCSDADPNFRIMAEEVYNVIHSEIAIDSTIDIIYIDTNMNRRIVQ